MESFTKKTIKDSMLEMQTNFEERMASFEADLQKKPSSSIAGLAEEFLLFKSFVLETLKNFEIQVSFLTREVDDMETRCRRKILLLHGITENKGEDITKVISETVSTKLMRSFTINDIDRCHRMGRQQAGDKPRPVLIEFLTVRVRDNIWMSKSKLKGTGVTVSEFLTRCRHTAFMAARERYGVTKCWTREGSIFFLSPDGSRHRITSMDDLNHIQDAETRKPAAVKAVPPKLKRAAATKK